MAQNAMTSFKQELNQMAFNIKGAADQLISMKSELTIRNEVDTPALNQKLDALITLLSQQQSGGSGQVSIPQLTYYHPSGSGAYGRPTNCNDRF
nr:hypothetical protein P5656_06030 [Bacillus subtilis]